MLKKLCIGILSFCLVFSVAGCSDDLLSEDSETEQSSETTKLENGLSITVDKDSGDMSISRPKAAGDTHMGDEDVWTIFVYMCGSDLESESGLASNDLDEMLSVDKSDAVRFVVQTGGSSSWENKNVNRDESQRFLIQNKKMTELTSSDDVDMGESSSLTDFLSWGVENYASEHMGVIFWNHGGGSISGVCYDENHDDDQLTLREIDAGLLSVYEDMTDNFEFIGFDACLMATVETANICASYADYMYASEEEEPGQGWNYEDIGNYIADHKDTSAKDLGVNVCDSLKEENANTQDANIVTLSVTDLSKINTLIENFNTFAQNMYKAAQDSSTLSSLVKEIEEADAFGSNSFWEGYTNMIDLKGMVEGCSDEAKGAKKVLSSLEDAVVYKVSGSTHKSAGGLALYYPITVNDSSELSVFSDICVSPYYCSFVDMQNHGSVFSMIGSLTAGDSDDYEYSDDYYSCELYDDGSYDCDYSDDYWYDDDNMWEMCCQYAYDELSDSYECDTTQDDYWNYCNDYEVDGESQLITFSSDPAIDSDGYYSFVLDENGLKNTANVYAEVYAEEEDDNICLGQTWDVSGDWDSGEFIDGFDGYWLSLPDGQNLNTEIVDWGDDYITYSTPILLNGDQTNLRITQYDNDDVYVEGIWDGVSDNGSSSRKVTQLEDGDVINILYDCESSDDYYYGDDYVVDGELTIDYNCLYEGDYYYNFVIEDVYGNFYTSDYVILYSDGNGETYLYEN
ncbi:MAG: hypothetical protein K6G01_07445 [Eubacterium sp.]|nr:hypothetical protein [Eubacterium sp.]